MGRKSLVGFGEVFLGIGVIAANLKFSGKVSCAIHLLKISLKTALIQLGLT